MGSYAMLLQFMLAGVLLASIAAPLRVQPGPDCPDQCGNVSIPFPFGIGKGCYFDASFSISCNQSGVHAQPFYGNIPVRNISLNGEIRLLCLIAYDCYNKSGDSVRRNRPSLTLGQFTISDTQNNFVAIGCDTYATIQGYQGNDRYTTGCMSICDSQKVVDDSCSGVGCCEIPIPKGLENSTLTASSYFQHKNVTEFNSCSYAFVVEKEFTFSPKYLQGFEGETRLPMVVDWAVGDESCELAAQNNSTFLCKGNSTCDGSYNGRGYRCKCVDGYQGNPYLDGCYDIDECNTTTNPDLHKCEKPGYCVNELGNYTCKCPKGYHGDGRKGGKGCIPNQIQLVQIALGVSICSVAVVAGSAWLYMLHKKRKLIKLKEKFFKQNGGLMLQQQLTGRDASSETAKIFTAEELKRATSNYDESMIVGRGGYGTVYKGILESNNMVAIKKSKIVDQSQIEQFINEVVVLSQINHRNVVKLLGCCLEEEVPLLVYEFVANGTLFDHIHDKGRAATMPWGTRLRIAAETAGVLSYLHSAASIPIIHRDVKTTNILLDDNYTAKVSDFGASRLVPVDQTQLSTMVQGTLGYLDPEYLHTNQLTEKSDVYSFGVVLLELLTGRKAIAFDRPEEERSLAKYFLSSLRKDRLFDILETHLVDEENRNQIMEVAKLAMRCLEIKGEERPSMKEVAMELEGLRLTEKHPWVNLESNSEETEYLLDGKPSDRYSYGGSRSNTSSGYDSIQSHVVILPLDNGR
ncbi:Wall-associated kinase 2, putative [Theobroma cacao]|uniref:Wall-associated kinase 2, putative n=1 Tax=Theobroma cacao TaxID=3641 RepID=A0A061FIF5_THECC|nr:Wall-associated kinase 2, putative [Theobroma cacao]